MTQKDTTESLRAMARRLIEQGAIDSAWLSPRRVLALLDGANPPLPEPPESWPSGLDASEEEWTPSFEEAQQAVDDLRRRVAHRKLTLSTARAVAIVVWRLKALERERA